MVHPLQGKLLFPFVAPPNGGKGTQTRILSEQYSLPTFDMGATFRTILKHEPDSPLAREIKQYMNAGKLVPIETVMKVFVKGLESLAVAHPQAKGFILDGFPRNLEQAGALITLSGQWGSRIAQVISMRIPDDVAMRRATGRRFCTLGAHRTYNIYNDTFRPQHTKKDAAGNDVLDAAGNVIWLCDDDGAELEMRSDDKPDKVLERLNSFHEETQPVIDLFIGRNELYDLDGNRDTAAVTRDILAVAQPFLDPTPV